MTKVQMLVGITGGRADGSVWPAAGEPLKTTKAEAEDLYLAQLARPWPGGDEEEQTVEAAATAQTEALVEASEPPVQWPPAEPGRMGHHVPEPEPEPAAESDVPAEAEAPRPAAPKADWVDWAVAQGATEEEAAASTKQQLMEQYGARP